MAKKSGFGAAFAAARAAGKKTFEYPPGSGKKYTTQTKEEKDREVTPEAKKVMDTTRRDRESNFRNQVRKSDVAMETPEERGAMNLKGFKRAREAEGSLSDKDRKKAQLDSARESSQAGRYGTMKSGGAVKMKGGGKVSSCSKRADGVARKGKTKGKFI